MKKYKIGYTQGTFDMFHIGHLNLLNQAKDLCDYLIVGVNSDELVESYKNKKPVVHTEDRKKIIENIKAVDQCIVTYTLDKKDAWMKIHFDVIFIGDDWKGNPRWLQTEKELAPLGALVIYLNHTEGISSSFLRPRINEAVID